MTIRILIADDNQDTKDNLIELFSNEDNLEIIGTATNGKDAVELSRELIPDIVIMDINMPVMNGLEATEKLSIELPQISVIIISVQDEPEYLRKSMLAGAKDYLTKPFNPSELLNTIQKIYEREKRKKTKDTLDMAPLESNTGKIFTFFSTKGGCGKTTLLVNIAIALKKVYPEKNIAIIDSKLQFGDVAMFLNIKNPATIYDMVNDETVDFNFIDKYFKLDDSGIYVLACPEKPQFADEIRPDFLGDVLSASIERFDFVFIDTSPVFREIELQIIDATNGFFFLILTPEVTSVKNAKETLEIIESLGYPKEKIKIILNRSDTKVALTRENIENTLDLKIQASFPSNGEITVPALNKGKPFVISNPESKISKAIFNSLESLLDISENEKRKSEGFMDKIKNILR